MWENGGLGRIGSVAPIQRSADLANDAHVVLS